MGKFPKDKDLQEEKKRLKKLMVDISDVSGDNKREDDYRRKYGINSRMSYSMDYTLGIIIANALLTYIAEGKGAILRNDWDLIEKHALAIKEFCTNGKNDCCEFDGDNRECFTVDSVFDQEITSHRREKDWREAMFWLQENWLSLWW